MYMRATAYYLFGVGLIISITAMQLDLHLSCPILGYTVTYAGAWLLAATEK